MSGIHGATRPPRIPKAWALLLGITLATLGLWLALPRDPFRDGTERSMNLSLQPARPDLPGSWLRVGMSGPGGGLYHRTLREDGAPQLKTSQLTLPQFEGRWADLLKAAPREEPGDPERLEPPPPGQPWGEVRLRADGQERVYRYVGPMPASLRPLFEVARAAPPSQDR